MSRFVQIAQQVGELVERKNAAYGNSFAKAGEFLRLLYPNGVQPDQMEDSLLLVRVFDKCMRIATDKDALGEDPWADILGYALLALSRMPEQPTQAAKRDDNSGQFLAQSLEVKFWAKVDKRGSDDCWEWLGKRDAHGNGLLTIYLPRPCQLLARRVSWELKNGPIPPGTIVYSPCSNTGCVNPDHLLNGTQADSMKQMRSKGRGSGNPKKRLGESNGSAILTAEKVRQIRAQYRPRVVTQPMLAKQYGVSVHTIAAVLRGHIWQHVGELVEMRTQKEKHVAPNAGVSPSVPKRGMHANRKARRRQVLQRRVPDERLSRSQGPQAC
ncbi:MAG: HNH endonuclease [Acidobacteriaceae bacterium]